MFLCDTLSYFNADFPGLTAYWENEYHHQDISPKPSSTRLTYYNSFMRLSRQALEKCGINTGKVLETTIYKDREKFKVLNFKSAAIN